MFAVFLPVVVLVGLTLGVNLSLLLKRRAGVKADPTLLQRSALDASLYQEEARKSAANLANLFETPVLFYVGAIFAILFGATGVWTGLLCWTYVLSRIAHTVIHTTANVVLWRFAAYAVSIAALVLLWITLVFEAEDSLVLQIGEIETQRERFEETFSPRGF